MRTDGNVRAEAARYVLNGLVATAVHFSVLMVNLEVLGMRSAGAANGVAAVFGITASFLGSRYFVFHGTDGRFVQEGFQFVLVYAGIAALHALILFAWTDRGHLDYRIGFVLATGVQVTISYLANKKWVFA